MSSRFLAIVLLMGLFAAFFPSCKKCHTCIVKDEDNAVRYTYPEVCGSKKDLKAYADLCETEYGAFDFTCECSEDL